MDKISVIAGIESYKYKVFSSPPAPPINFAYVLYVAKQPQKYLVINEGDTPMSYELRAGKYDKIMTISLATNLSTEVIRIACSEENHYFDINITLDFCISDPGKFYENRTDNVLQPIRAALEDVGVAFARRYSYSSVASLDIEVKSAIRNRMNKIPYLSFEIVVKSECDMWARKILDAACNDEVSSIIGEIQRTTESKQLVGQHDIDVKKVQNKNELSDIQDEHMHRRAEAIFKLLKEHGDDTGIVFDLLNGNVTGTTLTSHRITQRHADFKIRLDALLQIMKEANVSEEDIKAQIFTLLKDSQYLSENVCFQPQNQTTFIESLDHPSLGQDSISEDDVEEIT